MIYLIELRPIDPATGAVRVLRYGTRGYTTGPNDTPANAEFLGRVRDPADQRAGGR